MTKESTLYEMLVEDTLEARHGLRFLKGYGERGAVIYNEAHVAARDGSVHPDFAPYYEGQLLFYLHQTMFLKLASDCGLESWVDRCEQNGFPSAVVKMGRFHFTNHHGASPSEVKCLNPSLMRAQNSNINMSLLQGNLFEPPFDNNKLRKANNIYGNFIHGCRGTGNTFTADGFMQIAFPCVADVENTEDAQKKLRYVERYSLYSLINHVTTCQNERRRIALPKVRIISPKIKKQQ
ncbi:MAG TPA: hypothetical protein VFX97_01550 [Pyrinomonadaceae bacterium]|nr:hypothetical protein [Pyrinomonadaceae bacterium]